jgi:hypothetical protein
MLSDLLDKITSYNLFNYLLPGAVFAFFADRILVINLIPDDLITSAFLYYFLGVVVSRFGSLIVEPVLKKAGVVKFEPYASYLSASEKDSKIEVLVESANMYRTFVSAFLLLLLLGLYGHLETRFPALDDYRYLIGGLCITGIFLFAYVKQTKFIISRIRRAAPPSDGAL